MALGSYLRARSFRSLWPGQRQIVESVLTGKLTRGNVTSESARTTCVVGNKVGGSFAAATAIAAWLTSAVGAKVTVYAAPPHNVLLHLRRDFSHLVDEDEICWSTDPDDFARSRPDTLYVVDNADRCPDVYIDPLLKALTAPGARVLLIGSPTDLGAFPRSHQPPAGCTRIRIPATEAAPYAADHPGLAVAGWIEDMQREHGPDSDFYRRRVLALFPWETP